MFFEVNAVLLDERLELLESVTVLTIKWKELFLRWVELEVKRVLLLLVLDEEIHLPLLEFLVVDFLLDELLDSIAVFLLGKIPSFLSEAEYGGVFLDGELLFVALQGLQDLLEESNVPVKQISVGIEVEAFAVFLTALVYQLLILLNRLVALFDDLLLSFQSSLLLWFNVEAEDFELLENSQQEVELGSKPVKILERKINEILTDELAGFVGDHKRSLGEVEELLVFAVAEYAEELLSESELEVLYCFESLLDLLQIDAQLQLLEL